MRGEGDETLVNINDTPLRGSTLRSRSLEDKAAVARAMERHVLALFERGELRVPVAETFRLDEVAAAYDRFAAGGKLGKIVLVMDDAG